MEQRIDGEPEEEYESIPWESILRDGRDDRTRRFALGAGLVVGAVAVGLASRALVPPAAPDVVEIPVAVAPPASPSAPTTTSTVPPSEADLMAVLPPDLSVAAATTAEWFLADFFTLDGTGRRLERWVGLPRLDAPDPDWRSTVRTVETVGTRMPAVDRFLVTVLVGRTVTPAPGADPIEETAVFEVLVGIDGDRVRVLDLPRPSAGGMTGDVPPPVLTGAIEALGPGATVDGPPLAIERRDDRWRVVLGLVDAAGLVWPVVVWVDEGGMPVPTAAAGSAEVGL